MSPDALSDARSGRSLFASAPKPTVMSKGLLISGSFEQDNKIKAVHAATTCHDPKAKKLRTCAFKKRAQVLGQFKASLTRYLKCVISQAGKAAGKIAAVHSVPELGPVPVGALVPASAERAHLPFARRVLSP